MKSEIEKEAQVLAEMQDDQTDVSDVPEMLNWDDAERGRFYRPLKESVTLRLDRDVVAWFRAQGRGYQTRINEALRDYVANHRQPR